MIELLQCQTCLEKMWKTSNLQFMQNSSLIYTIKGWNLGVRTSFLFLLSSSLDFFLEGLFGSSPPAACWSIFGVLYFNSNFRFCKRFRKNQVSSKAMPWMKKIWIPNYSMQCNWMKVSSGLWCKPLWVKLSQKWGVVIISPVQISNDCGQKSLSENQQSIN